MNMKNDQMNQVISPDELYLLFAKLKHCEEKKINIEFMFLDNQWKCTIYNDKEMGILVVKCDKNMIIAFKNAFYEFWESMIEDVVFTIAGELKGERINIDSDK